MPPRRTADLRSWRRKPRGDIRSASGAAGRDHEAGIPSNAALQFGGIVGNQAIGRLLRRHGSACALSATGLQRYMKEHKARYDPKDTGTRAFMDIVHEKYAAGAFDKMSEKEIEGALYDLYSMWDESESSTRKVKDIHGPQSTSKSWEYGEEQSTSGAESAFRIVIPINYAHRDSEYVQQQVEEWIKKNSWMVKSYKRAASTEKKAGAPDTFIIYTMMDPRDVNYQDLHDIIERAKSHGVLKADAPFYEKHHTGAYFGRQPTAAQKEAGGESFGSVRTGAIAEALGWLAKQKGPISRDTFDATIQR